MWPMAKPLERTRYLKKAKHKTKSFTVKKVPTDDLWQAHLDGSDPALGIIPIREGQYMYVGMY